MSVLQASVLAPITAALTALLFLEGSFWMGSAPSVLEAKSSPMGPVPVLLAKPLQTISALTIADLASLWTLLASAITVLSTKCPSMEDVNVGMVSRELVKFASCSALLTRTSSTADAPLVF